MTIKKKDAPVTEFVPATPTPVPQYNTLLLTDEELKALSDIARQSKVTASTEELLMIKLGKSNSPLLDVVYKVAVAWENRANELNAEAKAQAATQV